jgi:hypothetical protein
MKPGVTFAIVLFSTSLGGAAGAPPPAIVFHPAGRTATDQLPFDLAAADFDEDGMTDLAVSTIAGTVSIFLGRGDGTFDPGPVAMTSPRPYALAVADFNGDGHRDLAVTDIHTASMRVAFGHGDGSFEPAATYDAGMNAFAAAAGDFNGDGLPDLFAGGTYFGMSVLLNLGAGAMGSRIIVHPDAEPPFFFGVSAYTVADFDGDGRDDLASSGFLNYDFECSGAGFTHWKSQGAGAFAPSHLNGLVCPYDIAVSDWDRDGRKDVLNLASDGIAVHRNLGGGAFSPPLQPLLAVPDLTSEVLPGDFNLDGIPDLALGQYDTPLIVLKAGNGDGTLAPDAPLWLSDHFDRMIAADFDGDGRLDLAANETGFDSIAVSLNRSGSGVSPVGEAAFDAATAIRVTGYDPEFDELRFTFGAACGATAHIVVYGDLASPSRGAYSGAACTGGSGGATAFTPGIESVFFVVAGSNGASEGSYGRTSQGDERPEAIGLAACDLPQDLTSGCP